MIHLIQLKNGKQYKIGDKVTFLPTPPEDGEKDLGIKTFEVTDLLLKTDGFKVMMFSGDELRIRHIHNSNVSFYDVSSDHGLDEVEWEDEE